MLGRGKGKKERRKTGREGEREGGRFLLAVMTITFTVPEFERSQNYHLNT